MGLKIYFFIRTGPPLLGRWIRFLGFYIPTTQQQARLQTGYAFHTCCDHGPAVLDCPRKHVYTSLDSQRTLAGARPGLGLVLWLDSTLVKRLSATDMFLRPTAVSLWTRRTTRTSFRPHSAWRGVACLVDC